MYHRACIDPWLLKHRSCPLCKQNVLIACGLPLRDEDIDYCSATTSEANSIFSLSSSSPSSTNSNVISLGFFMNLLFCRCQLRHRRRQHNHLFNQDFDHGIRRHSSSLDEISVPSGGSCGDGGRRILGSASENSSSSITGRSVPSDRLFHASNISPPIGKGARINVASREVYGFDEEKYEHEKGPLRIALCICGKRSKKHRQNFINSCSCSENTGVEKEPPMLTSYNYSITPFVMYPPFAIRQSTALPYFPRSKMSFNSQISLTTKSVLPSYEQVSFTVAFHVWVDFFSCILNANTLNKWMWQRIIFRNH